MSKAGKRLLDGVNEAIAVARGDPDAISKIRVTPSCGCVFCDMGLLPDWVCTQPAHYLPKEGRYIECNNPEYRDD